MATDSQYATLGGSVQTGEVDPGAITTAKIADANVTNAKLGNDITWKLLYENTLTGAGSFDTGALTGTVFKIILYGVYTAGGRTVYINFNSDTGNNYTNNGVGAQTYITIGSGGTTANCTEITIVKETSGVNASVVSMSGNEGTASVNCGVWHNALSLITSIQVGSTANMTTPSRILVYGGTP